MARRQPMRRCVHCGASRPKGELMRMVRTADGGMALDPSRRQAGRGAYVCPEAACVEGLLRSKRSAALFGGAPPHDLANSLREACGR